MRDVFDATIGGGVRIFRSGVNSDRVSIRCTGRCGNGGCSSAGRAPGCGPGRRGFEPRQPPPGKPRSLEVAGFSLEYAESSPVASGELVFDLTDRVLRKKVGCLFEQDACRHVR